MKYLFSLILTIFTLSNLVLAQTKAEKLIDKGNIQLEQAKFEKALKLYRKASAADSELKEAHYRIALAHYNLYQLDEAEQKLQYLLDYFPPSAEVTLLMGQVQFKKENWLQALEYYIQTSRLDENNAVSYEYSGHCYSKLEEWNLARQKYEKCLSIEPNSPDAIFHLGRCLDELGSTKRAQRYYSMAMNFRNYRSNAHLNLAMVHQDRKDFEMALRHINIHLEETPDNPEGAFTKGTILKDLGDQEAACQWFEKSLDLGHEKAREWLQECLIPSY